MVDLSACFTYFRLSHWPVWWPLQYTSLYISVYKQKVTFLSQVLLFTRGILCFSTGFLLWLWFCLPLSGCWLLFLNFSFSGRCRMFVVFLLIKPVDHFSKSWLDGTYSLILIGLTASTFVNHSWVVVLLYQICHAYQFGFFLHPKLISFYIWFQYLRRKGSVQVRWYDFISLSYTIRIQNC